MSFNRRTLIAGAMAIGVTLDKGYESLCSGISNLKNLRFGRKKRILEATVDRAYVAQPNAIIKLPDNAPDGAIIRIAVDKTSLSHPCMIQSMTSKVGGESEPLVLDSLAIVKLRYDKSANDWLIG